MKKNLLLLSLLFCSLFAHAQDVIILKDGVEIKAKITEVLPNEIKYKRYDNLEGPLFTLLKTDILLLKYQNGQNEVIKSTSPITNNNIASNNIASNIGSSEELCTKGKMDSNIQYRGEGSGAGWTFAITVLTTPLIGLIPAGVNSSSEVKDRNLNYKDSNLMMNPDYSRCYKKEAQKVKRSKNWSAFGVGSIIWLGLILIL